MNYVRHCIAFTLFLSTGCVRVSPYINPDHCASQAGDDWCIERHDGSLPFCDLACNFDARDGCVETRPADDSCYSPCGNLNSIEEESSCIGVAGEESTGTEGTEDSSSSDASTPETTAGSDATESESTTGTPECSLDADCTEDPLRPFCEGNACVSCTAAGGDAACATLADPTRGVCANDACVQCSSTNALACEGTTPVCNVETNVCICTAHEQCGANEDAACHIEAGTCFSAEPGSVLHVGDGQEFTSIEDALVAVGEVEPAVVVLHDNADPINHDEAVTLAGNRVVAFKLSDDASPNLLWIQTQSDENGGPTLEVSDGATAYLVDLRLRGNLDDGAAVVAASGATVYIEGGDISGNFGPAISADNARVFIGGSLIEGNGGGLVATGSTVTVSNSPIINNDGGGLVATANSNISLTNVFVGQTTEAIVIDVTDSELDTLYTTVVGFDVVGNTPALRCTNGTTRVRNSIIVTRLGAPGTEVACPDAELTNNATESSVGPFPDADPSEWFVDYDQGDYHLQNDGLIDFAGLALWQEGDPATDIDGDARPISPGPDVAGADVPTNP